MKFIEQIVYFIVIFVFFFIWALVGIICFVYSIVSFLVLKVNYLLLPSKIVDKPKGHKNYRVRFRDFEGKIVYVLCKATCRKEAFKQAMEKDNDLREHIIKTYEPLWLVIKMWWTVFNPVKYWTKFYLLDRNV